MDNRITVELKDGVADVRLVRADKMNALDDAMFSALIETGERLKTETGVRAIVLSGEGPSFCAGLDFASFMTMGSDARERLLGRGPESPANLAQRAAWIWARCGLPRRRCAAG